MPDWLFQLVTAFAAAAGVYGAIRADLREALVEVRNLKDRVTRLEGVK
jgi:hypothetical protein